MSLAKQDAAAATGATLTNCFLYLICQHRLHQRRVAEYASMLASTPSHLNETVKQTTGSTCSALLNTMLMPETRTLLRQTERSVTESANELNFQDLPPFTKYAQLTPVAFRRAT